MKLANQYLEQVLTPIYIFLNFDLVARNAITWGMNFEFLLLKLLQRAKARNSRWQIYCALRLQLEMRRRANERSNSDGK